MEGMPPIGRPKPPAPPYSKLCNSHFAGTQYGCAAEVAV